MIPEKRRLMKMPLAVKSNGVAGQTIILFMFSRLTSIARQRKRYRHSTILAMYAFGLSNNCIYQHIVIAFILLNLFEIAYSVHY